MFCIKLSSNFGTTERPFYIKQFLIREMAVKYVIFSVAEIAVVGGGGGGDCTLMYTWEILTYKNRGGGWDGLCEL